MNRFKYLGYFIQLSTTAFLMALPVGCAKSTDAPSPSGSDAGGQDAGETPLCELPFEAGPCEAAVPVYWYNAAIGKCEQKTYGGCEGNDNRFESLAECEEACRPGSSDAGGQDAGGQDAGETSLCELPFVAGPCEAAFQVYWYNAATGKCEQKTYGGCEGNDNRFESLAECEEACLDLSTVECESDSDCGWGEIGHDINSASDCMCLFGCPYIPLNQTTINRRHEQYNALCDPQRDGAGQICPIDDCVMPPPAECVDKRCTGDLYGAP